MNASICPCSHVSAITRATSSDVSACAAQRGQQQHSAQDARAGQPRRPAAPHAAGRPAPAGQHARRAQQGCRARPAAGRAAQLGKFRLELGKIGEG